MPVNDTLKTYKHCCFMRRTEAGAVDVYLRHGMLVRQQERFDILGCWETLMGVFLMIFAVTLQQELMERGEKKFSIVCRISKGRSEYIQPMF